MGVNPLISVVTINLNDGNGLSETLSSIFGQDCESSMFESVVIDGGSVDKSRDVILANEKRISYWCSEPDDGIYSAMNHGIQRSRGEYIVFLNSADIFASSNVLRNVIDGISSNGWADK